VVTVSLEMSGPDASRPHIEAARPEHPSLLDPMHRMDALFGVVNIPSVVWIDEAGMIVRPPEPGWPRVPSTLPRERFAALPRTGRAPNAPPPRAGGGGGIRGGQDRAGYADAVGDWVAKGAASEFALSPGEVVARSQPRGRDASAAAAHFELAEHLWRAGSRDAAIGHFRETHRLQPDNWTYKRQAWSLVGRTRAGGELAPFVQGPLLGEEEDWPFDSDMGSEIAALDEGGFYPKAL
jgi:hypothetical protein